jgi:ribosome biogenesis GTPase
MRVVTDLSGLGWTSARGAALPAGSEPARVSRVDRGRLSVLTADGERRVHPGAALYDGSGLSGPAVGDWVALRGELAVAVLPRTSAFVRTVAGRTSAAQVVAANLDVVLVVDALPGETRLRRVERYLAVAWSSGAAPVVVLTKADLCDDVGAVVAQVREDALGVDVLVVSSVTGEGLDAVRALLPAGRAGAMVGPSGVGKSSLVNALSGKTIADTGRIREGDGRGRHTTTARELHLLPGGGLLVDTPGMRELSLYDDADGVDTAYADVALLAAECRFRDCGHRTEPGCAVAAATGDGPLDPARYAAWRKLQAEAHRQLLRVDARARAAEKARLRSFHRSLKDQPTRMREARRR